MSIKSLIIASAAAGSLALAGCDSSSLDANTTAFISAVQAASMTACQFLPTAEAIASLYVPNDSTYSNATSVANIICKAATTTTVSKAAPPVSGPVVPSAITIVVDGKQVSGYLFK